MNEGFLPRSFLLLLFFLFLPFETKASLAPFIIEVQISGAQVDEDYVKIYNPLDREINVSHYQLKKKSSTGKEYSLRIFPSSTIIPPKGEIVWANSNNGYAQSLSAQVKSTANLSINNSIAFFDKNGKIINALGWGEGINQFFEESLYPFNPQAHQQLRRKQDQGSFQNTNSNTEDFYLFPVAVKLIDVIEEKSQLDNSFLEDNSVLGPQTPKSFPRKLSVFIAGLSFSFVFSFIVIVLKEKLS